MKSIGYLPLILVLVVCQAPADEGQNLKLFDRENLFGWSMMAFDAAKRGPVERCKVVKELGMGGYAIVPYTYKFEEIFTPADMDAEIKAMKEAGLRVHAVWADRLNPHDPLGTDLTKGKLHLTGLVVDALKRNKTKADVWFWMADKYLENFDQLTDAERTTQLAAAIDQIAAEIEPLGGRVGLYNHGGWLGKVENQIAVLKAMKQKNAGIALNLHHGSPDPESVSNILKQAGDHMIALVLNGHGPNGEKHGIHPFGSNDADVGTLQAILDSGYNGPVGILDHHFDSDTKERLGQSLKGLDRIQELLGK